VLLKGDLLFIPDREERSELRPTDKIHRFTVRTTDLKLRLILEDHLEKPIANAQCLLVLDSETRNVTTDGEGRIDETVPPGVRDAILVVQDAQTALHGLQIPQGWRPGSRG
jgi:hypothetical protein